MDWYLLELPVLCVGAALTELDTSQVGQWMVSRPLIVGPLLGWLCGALETGMTMGVLMELVTLDDLPVGTAVPLNAALATASAVLLSAGKDFVAPAAAFPAGLVFGRLFGRIDIRLRTLRAKLTRSAESALDAGRPIPFRRLLWRSLGGQVLAASVFLYAAVALSGPRLAWGWGAIPGWMRQGLNFAFVWARCLGWATLLFALRPKR